MDKIESGSPIQIILNGPNYLEWSQGMRSFLKGKKAWRYVTGDITAPTNQPEENREKFQDRLEEWDSKNHQAITWFRNSSLPSIGIQFGRYDTAKEVWDLLKSRYTTADLAHQYQILNSLADQKQAPGQSIADFLSQIQSLWDQLTVSEPEWKCKEDTALFQKYRDQQRLVQFLMALNHNFEPVRASLLHRVPLPSLENAVAELISEETRLGISKHSMVIDTVLATPSSSATYNHVCKFCKQNGHLTKDCIALRHHTCQHCHQKGHYSIQYCKKRSSRQDKSSPQQSAAVTSEHSYDGATSELESLLKQVLSKTNPPHTALSVAPGNSWYFDSACCNHMTNNSNLFSTKTQNLEIPNIQTADGSFMNVTHFGNILTKDLSLPDTYLVPNLTLNLISIGQLCDFGLDIVFTSSGCRVQDPQTGVTLGTGRRCGRLFELTSLHLPSSISPSHIVGTTPSHSTSNIWHNRLGHPSSARLQSLISSGHLSTVSKDTIDCVSCKLAKHHALPFSINKSISAAPFDLIHSDIWGPSPTPTMGGSRYFVIFIDDFSRFTWIYIMKNRYELTEIYKTFATMVHTHFSKKIKVFRTDNAMEYKHSEFLNFLASHGTTIERSCPYTSQQNGRAERKLRHILDTTRALLISSSCPELF